MYNGIINVYKEAGYTSHDVVAKLRGILKQKKIGHTGTLDPEAVGVLPVCLGNATRLCDMLTDKTKEYEAVLRLGVVTDTQDMTGTVLEEKEVTVTPEEVSASIASFLGEYMQMPPMYSALKVNGKKLYELARQGKEIKREARPVEILSVKLLSMELPRVRFAVACSKGTYIRTLCYDIGEKLGCGGAMESLKRTRVGSFLIDQALTLEQLEALRDENRIGEVVTGVEEVFEEYPVVCVKEAFSGHLHNGNALYVNQLQDMKSSMTQKNSRVRMRDADGCFYGVYEYDMEHKRYKPFKMFLPQG